MARSARVAAATLLRIAGGPTEPAEPVGRLRGAGAGGDVRRVVPVIVGFVLVALAVLVVILYVSADHKNSQITRLRHDGVPVAIKVTGCQGQLGGSGSNLAGYSCRGSFTLDGRRSTEPIPGDTLHPPGAVLRGVAVPGDPALVTTVGALAGEHASARVYILPTVLLVALALGVVAVVARRRGPRRA